MTITAEMIERVARDWTAYSGEQIAVEYIKGTFYGFGSELATLRLFRKYAPNKKTRQFRSVSKGYCFSLDVE